MAPDVVLPVVFRWLHYLPIPVWVNLSPWSYLHIASTAGAGAQKQASRCLILLLKTHEIVLNQSPRYAQSGVEMF